MKPWLRSLQGRVFLAAVVVFMLGFASVILFVYESGAYLRLSLMQLQATEIAAGFSSASDPRRLPATHAGGALSYTLYDGQGGLLWYSPDRSGPIPRSKAQLRMLTPGIHLSLPRGRGDVITAALRLPDGAVLLVAKDDVREREVIGMVMSSRYVQALLLFLPLAALAAWLIRWLVKRSLAPLARAARATQGIVPEDPGYRLDLRGMPQEVAPLAAAVNLALERLTLALERERQLVADAAHELRTPLTVLDLRLQQGQADGALDWPAVQGNMQDLRRRVHQLLSLAQHERARQGAAPARARLARVCREVVAAMMPLYDACGRRLSVALIEGAVVRGHAEEIKDAIRNGLENALWHGEGEVRLRLHRSENGFVLDICDEGDGIPPAHREAVFERFRKGAAVSAGSGLGLAIVRRVMHNAGGSAAFVSVRPCVLRLCFVAA